MKSDSYISRFRYVESLSQKYGIGFSFKVDTVIITGPLFHKGSISSYEISQFFSDLIYRIGEKNILEVGIEVEQAKKTWSFRDFFASRFGSPSKDPKKSFFARVSFSEKVIKIGAFSDCDHVILRVFFDNKEQDLLKDKLIGCIIEDNNRPDGKLLLIVPTSKIISLKLKSADL